MSTVAEIQAALPALTTDELLKIEKAVHEQFQHRGKAIIYDDAHGIVTEADLIADADQAFQAYDREEAAHAKRHTR